MPFMEVKGTAFLARRALVEQRFGGERFGEVVKKISETDPFFRAPVLATTRIPMASFLRFNQELINELFDGDTRANFALGEASADWALSGPYKQFVTNRSVDAFVGSSPAIYRNYYDEGEARAETVDGKIALSLTLVPAPYRSEYIEFGIMGYFRRGLELVSGKVPKMSIERGFSRGDADVLYHFVVPVQ